MQNHIQDYCTHCHAGRMKWKKISLFAHLDHQVIVVPDYSARICDVCGQREYDTISLAQLKAMFNQQCKPGVSRSPK